MRFFMFYVSIIFQKILQVYPYSSILITIFTCNQWEISSIYDAFCHLGRGGPEKKLDILGGDPKKKMKIFKFSPSHPPPPFINNEHSPSCEQLRQIMIGKCGLEASASIYCTANVWLISSDITEGCAWKHWHEVRLVEFLKAIFAQPLGLVWVPFSSRLGRTWHQ